MLRSYVEKPVSSLFNKMVGLYDDRLYSSNPYAIYASAGITEVEIDGRTFWVRLDMVEVLASSHLVADAISRSLGKPFPWAVGFSCGNSELPLDLWIGISGISGFDAYGSPTGTSVSHPRLTCHQLLT